MIMEMVDNDFNPFDFVVIVTLISFVYSVIYMSLFDD